MKFYHRFPGAKFFMPNGAEICFAGGEIETDNLKESDKVAVELELKKIANVPSSMIYTKEAVADSSEGDVVAEIQASATVSFDGANKVPQGTKTVALPQAETAKPTLKPAGQPGAAKVAEQTNTPVQQSSSSTAEKIAAARKAIEGANKNPPAAGVQPIKTV